MRGSDPDAAIYWLMRMLESGDDPLFVLRRMIIFASEDVGNADPRALEVAVAADAAFRRLGMPEGLYPLAQACLYLASAAQIERLQRRLARRRGRRPRARRAPRPHEAAQRGDEADEGRGLRRGYRYAHDEEGGVAEGETYLPEELHWQRASTSPRERGYEKTIAERLRRIRGEPQG
jgi:putative ATPase